METRSQFKVLKQAGSTIVSNFKATSSAYLSPASKFYKISMDVSQIKYRLEGLINSGEYSNYILNIKNISATKSSHDIRESTVAYTPEDLFFLITMQSKFGVPELIGWREDRSKYYVKTYSRSAPQGMHAKEMARQLLLALKILHDEGIVHGRLISENVRWDGDEIKLVAGHYYGRGDLDWWARERYQPAYDMKSAGRIIYDWNTNRGKYPPQDSDLHALSLVLLNEEPGLRISASTALDLLDRGSLEAVDLSLDHFNFPEFLKIFSGNTLREIVNAHTQRLLAKIVLPMYPVRKVTQRFDNILWHTRTKKQGIYWLSGTCTEGKSYCGKLYKCAFGDELDFPPEPLLLQTLGEANSHRFQKVVKQELFRSKEGTVMFMLILPQYTTEPKEKNIVRLATQLLEALDVMHSLGLIHGCIDPMHIGWDQNDSLTVLDLDSVVFVNRSSRIEVDFYTEFGNRADGEKKIESDIYSAGKVIDYYAKKWHQESEQIAHIIAKMTTAKWYERIPLDIARSSFALLAESSVAQPDSPSKRRRW